MMGVPEREKYGTPWDREESILAFELYCRIPFQTTKANNPAVSALATLLKRTPASVARKLGNFGAFDPSLQMVEIKGLTHTSKLDRQVWDEFHADWNGLILEASLIRKRYTSSLGLEKAGEAYLNQPSGPSERERLVRQRLHQDFFREAVLSSYDASCCVTGIRIHECLIASHIVPWSKDEKYRADPTNGLCLSATFDRLFDAGLMTITGDLLIQMSPEILSSQERTTREMVAHYNGRSIRKPHRFSPCVARLQWHSSHVFRR